MTTRVLFTLLVLRIPSLQLTRTSYPQSRRGILQLAQISIFVPFLKYLRHLPPLLKRKLLWESGGPDGLRPKHLKDLISELAEKGGRKLLSALTSFIERVLQGNVPLFVHPILFGATLIALRKKEGV